MAAIGKVSAVFTASTSGLTSGIKSASTSLRSLQSDSRGLETAMRGLTTVMGAQLFASVASGAAAAASALAGLASSAVGSLSRAVDAATSLGEETSKSAVIFGNSAPQIAKFADGAAAIGLSRTAALQATGAFGNLFTAMGLGSSQAASYATTLTSLGADLASFNNSTVDEAVQALGAALRGEAEPIRRFGVLLDDATLKQAALSAGLIKSTKDSLTPAVKAQAAYAAILQQTGKAQGDFARTSDSLANLSRVIQAQTANVFANLGAAFQPLYQAVASAASQVLTAVGPVFEQVSQGIQASVGRISDAIRSLIPSFVQFVGTVDGNNIGRAVGEGILEGARFLAGVGDFLIANLGSTFQYLSDVGTYWAGVLDIGGRIANLFFGAFKVFETVGNVIGGLFSDIIFGLYQAAAGIASVVPGFGSLAAELQSSADAWNGQGRQFAASMNDNADAASAAFSRAFSESSAAAGPRIAGPLTTALDAAVSRADSAAAAVSQAASTPVSVEQQVVVSAQVESIGSQASELATSISQASSSAALAFGDAVSSSVSAAGPQLATSISQASSSAALAFGDAVSSGVSTAGPQLSGAMTSALAAATSQADATAAKVAEVARTPLQVQQEVSVNVQEALKGIDSRSQEGVSEMFRIMRGGAGDLQQRQLDALERIAENTSGGEDSYPLAFE